MWSCWHETILRVSAEMQKTYQRTKPPTRTRPVLHGSENHILPLILYLALSATLVPSEPHSSYWDKGILSVSLNMDTHYPWSHSQGQGMPQLFWWWCLSVILLGSSILICQQGQHILSRPLQSSRTTEKTTAVANWQVCTTLQSRQLVYATVLPMHPRGLWITARTVSELVKVMFY